MNVSLTKELEEFINRKVESGRYTSASEVVREALRLLEQHETSREEQLQRFNAELDRRIASLDRGEYITEEESRRRIAALSRDRRKRTA
jgi:antitoxin ParD1/3/4